MRCALCPLAAQPLVVVLLLAATVMHDAAPGADLLHKVGAQMRMYQQAMQERRRAHGATNVAPPELCSKEGAYNGWQHATTLQRAGDLVKVYQNLLFHNGKWYALLTPGSNASDIPVKVSHNTQLVQLPVSNVETFLENIKVCHVPGATLHIDFPFPAFADNLGNWGEIMLPTYSALSSPSWKELLQGNFSHVERVLLANLPKLMLDWFQEILKLAVGPAAKDVAAGPPVFEGSEMKEWAKTGWVQYENLVVINDRSVQPLGNTPHSHPLSKSNYTIGFNKPHLAEPFRNAAHDRHQWPHAEPWTPGTPPKLPKYVTVMLYPEDYPPVVNHYDLVDMLEEVVEPLGLQVRVVSLTMEAPFLSHMATMSETAVLVARHGPLLASAMLLPPGAMVLELLPYKWDWLGISTTFYNMTQSTGQLHHFAWRPKSSQWCWYKDASDKRYSNWTRDECGGRQCLLVHAKAGLEVDLDAVKALVAEKLPRVLAGESVEALRAPWPKAE